MEVVHKLGQTSVTTLKSINKTRLFYHSYSLADIINGKGDNIRESVRDRIPTKEVSQFEWPSTKPTTAEFNIWDDMLNKILSYMRQHHITLEDWYTNNHIKPTCLFYQSSNTVYIFQD